MSFSLNSRSASIVHPFNNNWNNIRGNWTYVNACFNRTSFQQQLKRYISRYATAHYLLQSYILSTTTETMWSCRQLEGAWASIVHPFNNNWNAQVHCHDCGQHGASIVHPFNNNWNTPRSPSTTQLTSFNRTSFQQQLKQVSWGWQLNQP